MSSPDAPAQTADPFTTARRRWFLAAAVALALTAAVSCLTSVYNFDVFWHLAGGEWMLENHRVLETDPFSVDPLPRWANVHWLFQVIVAAVHGVGGFEALTVMKALLAAATVTVLALALRREVPAGWLVLCGLLTIAVMEMRMRVRPEAFTMLFLAITVALTESVRRGASARRLWLLPVVMVLWVNMHGLYVLGLFVLWSAAIGAGVDRLLGRAGAGRLPGGRALAPLIAATAACLVSPWPLEAAAQPLLLWTRISGGTAAFTQGVSEFLPTWQSPYHLAVGIALLVPAAAACATNFRRLPIGHVPWLAAFAVLAALARRNVALAAPVCGYLLAFHGGALLRRFAPTPGLEPPAQRERKAGTRTPPRAPRLPMALTLAAVALALAAAAVWASEWPFRARQLRRRFGPGLYRPNYPIDIARRLGELDAPGDIFCGNWGDAGTFIYHSRPRRVWMDGRLEAHSFDRFREQQKIEQALCTAGGAGTVKLHDALRFFFVRWSSRDHLTALSASQRFRLLLVDRVGACFARTDWRPSRLAGGRAGIVPERSNLRKLDRPIRRDGRIDGMPSQPRRWWRQNPPPVYYPLGAMFLWLGWQSPTSAFDPADLNRRRCTLLSIRYLTAAAAEGLVDRAVVTGMLAQAHQQRALQEDVTCSAAVPVDFHSARALHLYGQLDLRDLADENVRRFAEQHVDALIRARQLDAAEAAAAEMLRDLPADSPAERRRACRALHGRIAERVRLSRERARSIASGQPVRARALTDPEIGLARQAIAELRAAAPTAENRLLLGDLLLNGGSIEAARRAYAEAQEQGAAPGEVRFRNRCCDAVGLKISPPPLLLPLDEGPVPAGLDSPTARYYEALALEQWGRYDQALAALRGVQPRDEQLARLIDRLRRRLIFR